MAEDFNSVAEARERRRKRRRRQQRVYTVIALILVAVIGVCAWRGGLRLYRKYFAAQESSRGISSQSVDTAQTERSTPDEVTRTPEDLINEEAEKLIGAMTLEEKVSQLFFVTPEQLTGEAGVTQAGEVTRDALSRYPVCGVAYGRSSVVSSSQLKDLLSDTKRYSKYPIFLAIEEAGGSLSAVANATGNDAKMAPATLGEAADAVGAQEAGAEIGAYLSSVGFNLDIAPFASIAQSDGDDAVYGMDVSTVSALSVAMVKGLHSANVASCVGNFPLPGAEDHGGAQGATTTQKSIAELQTEEFVPFRDCITAGAEIVMLSNVSAPRATGGNIPCSISENLIVGQLRSTLGYDGIVMTDALDQDVITGGYTSDHVAVAAIVAGADVIYRPEDFALAHRGVVEAVQNGVITEERLEQSLKRILRVKLRLGL